MKDNKSLHVRTTANKDHYLVFRVKNALDLARPGEVVSMKDLNEWVRHLNVDVIVTEGIESEEA
jgi:hypothetical protein